MEARMANSVTFTVWPTRRQFEAQIKKNDFRDFDKAYKNAHIEASKVAAVYVCEAYVTIEAAPQHCTFNAREYKYPQSIIRSIMQSGLHRSYWDFKTRSWYPLPIDPEADEGHIIARKLLPPPKSSK